jgi:hypothetical protein
MAWRTFIVTIAFPFLALAYAVYTNVSPAPPSLPAQPPSRLALTPFCVCATGLLRGGSGLGAVARTRACHI